MRKYLTAILLVTSSIAHSSEIEAVCDLYKAKAELSSSILGSPYVYGSSNENNTATIGLAYSLSGRSKANLEKEIAIAKCDASSSTLELEEYQKWLLIYVQKSGAKVEIVQLLKARDLAKDQIALIERQIVAHTATVSEYNSSKQILVAIESKILALRAILAEQSVPISVIDVAALITKARNSEGQVAELLAKQESNNAWDITLSAGTQKDLINTNSSIEPFVGVSFKWSFGNYGIKESVDNIRKKTEILASSKQSGLERSTIRLLEKLDQLIVVEQDREILLVNTINDLQKLKTGITTATAIVIDKAIEVQIAVYSAELVGVRTRIEKYLGLKN